MIVSGRNKQTNLGVFGFTYNVGPYIIQDLGFGSPNFFYEGISVGTNLATITEASIKSAIARQLTVNKEEELERVRQAAIQLEKEAKEKKERDDKAAQEKAIDDLRIENQRIEDQRIEDQRIEDQRIEDQRIEDQRIEDQRIEDQRIEDLRLAEAERQRLAEAERQRLAAAERQRLAAAERQRLAAAERQRLAAAATLNNKIRYTINQNLLAGVSHAFSVLTNKPNSFINDTGFTNGSIDQLVEIAAVKAIELTAQSLNG